MSSTRTQTELVTQAAFYLGVLGEGQTIETDVDTRIRENVDAVALSLATRNIIDIPNTNDIPAEFFMDLATCVAAAASPAFEKPVDYQALAQAEDNLHKMARISPAPNDLLGVDSALRRTPYTYRNWASGT